MNFSSASLVLRWLVRDTFRQAVASRVSWLMAVFTGLAVFLCFSVGIHGDPKLRPASSNPNLIEHVPPQALEKVAPNLREGEGVHILKGQLTILFGAVEVPLAGTRFEMVRSIQLLLAGGVADTLGMFLALLWTAGFLPTFLEPASATVLLAKPIPRWSLLAGKFLGVLLFVLVQASAFVLGTWLALGLKTRVWDMLYLFSIPMLVLQFAVFFSFSTLLAVWTRSTVVCVFGSIVFWLACWTMNYTHHVFAAMQVAKPAPRVQRADLYLLAVDPHAGLAPAGVPWLGLAAVQKAPPAAPPTQHVSPFFLELAYWCLPKPADISNLLFHSLKANNYFSQLAEFEVLRAQGKFHPELSILSSLLFMLVMLGVAGYEFVHTDY